MCDETNVNLRCRIQRKRRLSEIMDTTTPITNYIGDDVLFSVKNVEPIIPKSSLSSLCQKHKKKQSRLTKTTAGKAVNSLPPGNMFGGDFLFPARNMDLVNPNSSPSFLHDPYCHQIYTRRLRNTIKTTAANFPPPTSTFINDDAFSGRNLEINYPSSPLFYSLKYQPKKKCSQQPNTQMSDTTANSSPPTNIITKTSNSELKTVALKISPITGIPALINAVSRETRVISIMDSVVNVYCDHTHPNFSMPWQRKQPFETCSSGFVIEGKRVLTSALSVEHYTRVVLSTKCSDTKYAATVLAIGAQCDIALLTVEDDEFWQGVSPVEFGDLPALQDAVTVVGYPIGGDTISVTSGVVSRIEILSYVHGSTELLGLQIDAAINSGNSGGPAFNDKGNCVGIAFQSLKHEDVENIGYVIPTPVIMHFIQDYEKNGTYTGFPILGVEWQKMENPDLRLSMGMKPDQKGVRIRRIDPTSPEFKVLKPSDIILSFDGVDIANDGTVPFRHGERIGFSYLVSQKYTGDSAAIKVLRNSQTLKFNVKLGTHRRLIPAHNKGLPPSYYIIAGFVFTTVSVPYLRSEYGKDYEYEAPVKLLDKLLHEMPQSLDEQIVVVSQVLVADINIGYEDIVNTQVLAFNGQPVKNLKSLASMVESCEDEYLKFDLEYQQIVVLQTKTAKAATLDIISTHCIPSAMSDDLKA